jgi:hypothetical protein
MSLCRSDAMKLRLMNDPRHVLLDAHDARRREIATQQWRLCDYGPTKSYFQGTRGFALHRVILQLRDEQFVFFVNGDRFDCRRRNMQVVTRGELYRLEREPPLKKCQRLLREARLQLKSA